MQLSESKIFTGSFWESFLYIYSSCFLGTYVSQSIGCIDDTLPSKPTNFKKVLMAEPFIDFFCRMKT